MGKTKKNFTCFFLITYRYLYYIGTLDMGDVLVMVSAGFVISFKSGYSYIIKKNDLPTSRVPGS